MLAPQNKGKEGPIDWATPKTTDDAESLMIAENFWESVEMKQAVEENRATRFEPRFAGIGRFRAIKPDDHDEPEESESAQSLTFYLGPKTRLRFPDTSLRS